MDKDKASDPTQKTIGKVRPVDTLIGEAVRQQLHTDRRTATLPLDVDVFDRIVFVHGTVPDEQALADIEAIIEPVEDVAEVVDELDVDPHCQD